jgi:hypothetical protein
LYQSQRQPPQDYFPKAADAPEFILLISSIFVSNSKATLLGVASKELLAKRHRHNLILRIHPTSTTSSIEGNFGINPKFQG